MSKLSFFIFGAWVLGAFLVIYNLGAIILHRRRVRAVFKNKREEATTHSYLLVSNSKHWRQFRAFVEDKNRIAGTNWSFRTFLVCTVILGLAGGILGLTYLANPAAALPLAVGFGLAPWLYISYFINKKQRLMADQLIPAIQYFVSEYGAIPNVGLALTNAAGKVSYPLSEELERLVMEINSGKDKEQALFSFARRVNSHWALRFAHLLNFKLSRGIDINPSLLALYMDIKTKRLKEKERSMESVGIRLENYALYLFVPVMYFLATKINPQSHYLLTQTPQGKRIVLLIVVLTVGGLFSLLKLNDNKVR